jgi:DNA repair protein RecO (recombination protein O)
MGIYKEEAIILRSMPYGEADRILTLFTRGAGKVAAIAKGVRKPSSRLRGAVQLFSHTHLVLYGGKALDTITQGDSDETFGFIEQDLDRLTAASCCAELVDRLTMERQPQPKLFQLLLVAMRTLDGSDPELLSRVFEIKLLDALGYRPQFGGCVMEHHDGRQVLQPGGTTAWFSIERGGVLCPACAANCPGALTLSPQTVAVMAYFLRSPLDRAVRVRIDKRNRLELASFLHSFICYHGDVRPRSWQFTTDDHPFLLRIRATPGLKNAEHRRIRAYSPD